MQLHAGDRYQVQPGSLLRFGAVTCRVEFSQQPASGAHHGRGQSEARAAAAPTVAVDPEATQVWYHHTFVHTSRQQPSPKRLCTCARPTMTGTVVLTHEHADEKPNAMLRMPPCLNICESTACHSLSSRRSSMTSTPQPCCSRPRRRSSTARAAAAAMAESSRRPRRLRHAQTLRWFSLRTQSWAHRAGSGTRFV